MSSKNLLFTKEIIDYFIEIKRKEMVDILVVKNILKLIKHPSNVESLMELNVMEIGHFSSKIFHVLNILHIILFQHFYIRSFWDYLLLIDFHLVILELLWEK